MKSGFKELAQGVDSSSSARAKAASQVLRHPECRAPTFQDAFGDLLGSHKDLPAVRRYPICSLTPDH